MAVIVDSGGGDKSPNYGAREVFLEEAVGATKMCLQKRGGQWRGYAAARASSEFRFDVVLLFIVPTWAGGSTYSGDDGGG